MADFFEKQHYSSESVLATAIQAANSSKDMSVVRNMLQHGACESIFVKGSTKQSLFCTLPVAMKPPSSTVEHSPPISISHEPLALEIDKQLSRHLSKLSSKPKAGSDRSVPGANSYCIEVGDLVSALRHPLYTLKNVASIDEAISLEKCLGDPSWSRVGVVVTKKDAKTSTVKEVVSGHRADYLDMELAFADRSSAGLVEKQSPQAGLTCFHCRRSVVTHDLGSLSRPVPLQPCVMCSRSLGDRLCGGALFECQSLSCKTVTCSACIATASLKEIPISSSDIEVSTTAASFPKDNLCNPDKFNFWQSAGATLPHWITVTLQPDWDFSCIQLFTQNFVCNSPNSITLFWSDEAGTAFTKIKDMSLSRSRMWVTLLRSSEIPQPSTGGQKRKVKIQINSNHQSGSDSKVSNIRVLATFACPLGVGDRVRLAPTFIENQVDGWCLGSVKDQRVGVVVAIGGQSTNCEQRNILVYCAASTTKMALFKASWLEIAPPTMKHCVGDLVQLNPATTCDLVDWNLVAGKCLGRPDQGHIGVVTAVGTMVAGIQRNVQVALLTSPPSATAYDSSSCARVSLYCASKLVRAEAWLSMHPQVTAVLVQAVDRAARKPDGTSRVNASVLVDRWGIHVWGKLLGLLGQSSMLEHVYGWIQACDIVDFQTSLLNKEVVDYYAGGVAPLLDTVAVTASDTVATSEAAVTENVEGGPPADTTVSAISTGVCCSTCGWENAVSAGECAACEATIVAPAVPGADICTTDSDPPTLPDPVEPSPQNGVRRSLRRTGNKRPRSPSMKKVSAIVKADAVPATIVAPAPRADICATQADPPASPDRLASPPQDGVRRSLRHKRQKRPGPLSTRKAAAVAMADAALDVCEATIASGTSAGGCSTEAVPDDGLPKEFVPSREQMAFSFSGMTGPNVFSSDTSKVWETNGADTVWMEFVLPVDLQLYDLSITTDESRLLVDISVIPLVPPDKCFPCDDIASIM